MVTAAWWQHVVQRKSSRSASNLLLGKLHTCSQLSLAKISCTLSCSCPAAVPGAAALRCDGLPGLAAVDLSRQERRLPSWWDSKLSQQHEQLVYSTSPRQ